MYYFCNVGIFSNLHFPLFVYSSNCKYSKEDWVWFIDICALFANRCIHILNRKRNVAQKNTILNSPYIYTMKFVYMCDDKILVQR